MSTQEISRRVIEFESLASQLKVTYMEGYSPRLREKIEISCARKCSPHSEHSLSTDQIDEKEWAKLRDFSILIEIEREKFERDAS